jgi:hypothetical protein
MHFQPGKGWLVKPKQSSQVFYQDASAVNRFGTDSVRMPPQAAGSDGNLPKDTSKSVL